MSSPHRLYPTPLPHKVSTLSTPFRPSRCRSRIVTQTAQSSAPLIFLAHGHKHDTASLHLILHFFSFFFFLFFLGSVRLNHVSSCLCLCLWFLKGKNENHRSEICVWFVILKGKIVNLKYVFVIYVFMFVIVFGFMFVFVILGWKILNQNFCFWFSLSKKKFCFWFWVGLVMRDGARRARGARGGGSGSWEKNPFSKRVGFEPRVLACGSGSGMKKPGPNSTRCHS